MRSAINHAEPHCGEQASPPPVGRGPGGGLMVPPVAGRYCPAHYGYAPAGFARAPDFAADTLIVVGGLYGNLAALDAAEALLAAEAGEARLVFNGDFHWFDIALADYAAIEARVLRHVALRGNVETELAGGDSNAGCGCAYPDSVSDAEVARSNAILRRLRHTARSARVSQERLGRLPMNRVAEVGGLRIGLVHGDAESLAGWRFSREALDRPEAAEWLNAVRQSSEIDVFASSHTCLPALRQFALAAGTLTVINNGAAGLPNFSATPYGVATRISTRPSGAPTLYGMRHGALHIDAVALHHDRRAWQAQFLRDWPAGSAAHASYWRRIAAGPDYDLASAAGRQP